MDLLQSRSSMIIMVVVNMLVIVMGILLWTFPARAIPSDRTAYAEVSGVVVLVKDQSGRKFNNVHFKLAGDERMFETRAVVFRGEAEHWRAGQTRLRFYIERDGPFRGEAKDPVPAYGLAADGRGTRSLELDIDNANAVANNWGALFALVIGCSGLGIAFFAYRRRRLA